VKNIGILAIAFFVLMFPFRAECRMGGGGPGSVPRVVYARPENQSIVDISVNKSIVFEWQMVPIPDCGRDSYKFVLHKGEGYDVIVDRVLDSRTFSVEVPADKFEDGAKYWWYVKQRSERAFEWSQYDIWYFKVVKK
jgi:hypothetical protein